MNLPVRNLATALPFYETVLGFKVLSRRDTPHNGAVLSRDQGQIGLAGKWRGLNPGRLLLPCEEP